MSNTDKYAVSQSEHSKAAAMLPSRIVITSFILFLQELTAGPIDANPFEDIEDDQCLLPFKLGFVKGSFGRRKFLEDCDGLGKILLVVRLM